MIRFLQNRRKNTECGERGRPFAGAAGLGIAHFADASCVVEGFYDELFMLSAKHRSLVALTVNEGDRRFANRIQRILGDRHVALDLGGSHAIAVATGYALAGKIPLLIGAAHEIFERGFSSLRELVFQPGLNIKMVGISDSKNFSSPHSIPFLTPHTYDETRSMFASMMNRHGPACLLVL